MQSRSGRRLAPCDTDAAGLGDRRRLGRRPCRHPPREDPASLRRDAARPHMDHGMPEQGDEGAQGVRSQTPRQTRRVLRFTVDCVRAAILPSEDRIRPSSRVPAAAVVLVRNWASREFHSVSSTTAGVRDLAVWRSGTRGGHRLMISGCVDSRRSCGGRGPEHRPWSLAHGV
jgi:hypothetical protein